MMEPPVLPSLEFLLFSSDKTLQDLELAALNRSANLIKAAKLEMEEAVAQRGVAEVARYFVDHREAILETARGTVDVQATLEFRKSA